MQVVFGHTFPDNAYGITMLDKLLLPFNNTGFLCTSMFFSCQDMVCTNLQRKRITGPILKQLVPVLRTQSQPAESTLWGRRRIRSPV